MINGSIRSTDDQIDPLITGTGTRRLIRIDEYELT